MKKLLFSLSLLLFVSLAFTSCKQYEITVNNTTFEYKDKCPYDIGQNLVVGKLEASSKKGTISYSIASQSIAGAFVINASTGEITIPVDANDTAADAIWDAYHDRNVRQATINVSIKNDKKTEDVTVTVNLGDMPCR